MRFLSLPLAPQSARIGLLGGSFDPAHEGHRHVTLQALKRFDLDFIWWLVSPGNPLKAARPVSLNQRVEKARAVMEHPRVRVTSLEASLGTIYTVDTLSALRKRRPTTRFVWLMGADNFADFHLWNGWREIMATTPIGVIARPGDRLTARRSWAAQCYEAARLPSVQSRLLGLRQAPSWCYINVPLNFASSTEIRSKGQWR